MLVLSSALEFFKTISTNLTRITLMKTITHGTNLNGKTATIKYKKTTL